MPVDVRAHPYGHENGQFRDRRRNGASAQPPPDLYSRAASVAAENVIISVFRGLSGATAGDNLWHAVDLDAALRVARARATDRRRRGSAREGMASPEGRRSTTMSTASIERRRTKPR